MPARYEEVGHGNCRGQTVHSAHLAADPSYTRWEHGSGCLPGSGTRGSSGQPNRAAGGHRGPHGRRASSCCRSRRAYGAANPAAAPGSSSADYGCCASRLDGRANPNLRAANRSSGYIHPGSDSATSVHSGPDSPATGPHRTSAAHLAPGNIGATDLDRTAGALGNPGCRALSHPSGSPPVAAG